MKPRLPCCGLFLVVLLPLAAAAACPADATPRAAEVLLTVQLPGRPVVAYKAADLAALPQRQLAQKRTVAAADGAGTEQSVSYAGVLLRDVLAKAGFAGATDHAARWAVVDAVASDNYRAVFTWGEVYNSAAGEQMLVITAQDGQALDAAEGPLALRALADIRTGPRHVRNLCALLVRP
jgi:hypothetical protein